MENYEELMLLYVDGELNEADGGALLAFVARHPSLAKELETYQMLRLQPDTALVYEGKETLLKKEPKAIAVNNWLRYGIAAGLVLLIGFAAVKWLAIDEHNNAAPPKIAQEQKEVHDKTPSDTTHTPEPILTSNTPLIPAPKKTVIIKPVRKAMEKLPVTNEIASLAPRRMKPLKEDTHTIADIALQQKIFTTETRDTAPKQKVNLLAWLPVNKEKQAGLEGLKNRLLGKANKAKEIANTINETDLVFKIGSKELFVLNF